MQEGLRHHLSRGAAVNWLRRHVRIEAHHRVTFESGTQLSARGMKAAEHIVHMAQADDSAVIERRLTITIKGRWKP